MMKTKQYVTAVFILVCITLVNTALAQPQPAIDSSLLLEKINVTAFQQNASVSCGTIVKVLYHTNADRFNKTSLVNAFNAVAGVRMEERSPGSYRINIRGSSLRSPFGVRNVKVYWNNIPITDAGGNTYFNQFAYNNFSTIEIIKGPAGSMYGAGTGGVLLINSFTNRNEPLVKAEYITGSYGLKNMLVSATVGADTSRSYLTYAHTESEGYRNNTASLRNNLTYNTMLKLTGRQQLAASVLYNYIKYQTPGGLTFNEFTANPRQARPAAGGLPSAATVKAAIYQQTFLAGLVHTYNITSVFKSTTSLYSAFAQVKNPTFRNYETRKEPGFGGRSTFVYEKKKNNTTLQLTAGAEWQLGFFNTQVAKNKNGHADTLQTNDDIKYNTYAIFAQANININDSWIITAGASSNKSQVTFTRLNSYPVVEQSRSYKNEISPRMALQKKLHNGFTFFASAAKGFSPPTIAELLPSTGVISTFLQAEAGTNYEAGFRQQVLKKKLLLEATVFYYTLNNALVARKDSSNADYYVNAGNTKQKGLELSADYLNAFTNRFVKSIFISSAYTHHNFKYGSFKKGTADVSGKALPGVPLNSISILADVAFKQGVYINTTFYSAAKIFLDDANTVAAAGYNLLGGRIGFKTTAIKKWQFNFYVGGDNLFNSTYSLGNDINAAGGRYYNAAAPRNYYVGLAVELAKNAKINLQ